MRILIKVIATLFPHSQNSGRQTVIQVNKCVVYVPLVTEKEQLEIYGRICANNAPGVDGNKAVEKATMLFALTFEAF